MATLSDEESVFNAALDLPDNDARASFLDKACAGDPALRRRVEQLLSAYGEDRYLDSPAPRLITTAAPWMHERPGTAIGVYKLLEQIGEGGMGLVFMAEQSAPLRRRVALKIIKPGLDTRAVIARFEAERQALALMDHPNIARVFDAGATESGRPFFVMELVRGVPITEYCQQGDVPLRQRLELFIEVCHAVQHAHQKGIIHRDLKPTNILVTQTDTKPLPKVIDFGVAKATTQPLTERTLFTAFAQIVGTPLYMSPEQADLANQDVDTRSDVYSLGVVLYELLTGTTPFDAERLRSVSHDEMRQIIREEEPPKPSTRATKADHALSTVDGGPAARRLAERSVLEGDLDWIVMKALDKDRVRRYESPSALADDIGRYLADQPIVAAAPSALYRTRKFVRRHRARVALSGVLIASCIVGVIGLGYSTLAITKSLEQTQVAERQAAQDRNRYRSERDRAETNLYVADVRLAHEEWKHAHLAATTRLLNAHLPRAGEPDLRGWEWHFLAELVRNSSVTLGDRATQFRAVAWSPDGRRLATADENYEVKIWDAANLRELRALSGHTAFVSCVDWSPDGRRIASMDAQGTLRTWDVVTGTSTVVDAFNLRHEWAFVAWSPDGKRLAACGGDETVKILDSDSGRELVQLPGHNDMVWGVAWSPDGRRLVSVDNWQYRTLRIWDVELGKLLASRSDAHGATVISVSWSPDGKSVATSSADCLVKIWDAETWEARSLVGHTGDVTSVRWSPDGFMLASSSTDGSIILWDNENGTPRRTLRGHEDAVRSVRWSADGRRLASASWDGTVRIWNPDRKQENVQFKAVSHAAWSPDSRQLAMLAPPARGDTERTLQVLDASTSNRVGNPIKFVSADGPYVDWHPKVAWSADGKRVAISYSTKSKVGVKIADVATRTESGTFSLEASLEPNVRSLAFSPDGSLIAAAIFDGEPVKIVVVWDSASGKQVAIMSTPEGFPDSVAWSPDGRRLAVTTFDGLVRIWNTTTWHQVMHLDRQPQDRRTGTGSGPHLVCWSPDGSMLAAGSVSGSVIVWDPVTGREILSFSAHSGKIAAVAFSPDGSRLVTGGQDKSAKIWDASTGAHLLTLGGHDLPIRDVSWSPSGEHLLTSGESGHFIWTAPGAVFDAGP